MSNTEFIPYRSRSRDQQDGFERHVWGNVQYVEGAGGVINVRGTDTLDQEAPILNLGYGFNLPENSNCEVMLVAMGSDTNQKTAFLTLPRDMQHPWGEGQGGIQHPTDPARRVEFNGDETWLKDGVFVLGHDRAVTVTITGDDVTIQMNGDRTLNIAGSSDVTIQGNAAVQVDGNAEINVDGNADLEIGGAATVAADTIDVTADGNMSLTAGGNMDLNASNVRVTGGGLTHNGTNVGDNHTHGGVDRGGSNTDGPH